MPPMAAEDGGWLWLVGNILKGVDADFSNGDWMGTDSHDGTEHRYVESRKNQKGERQFLGIVETPYNDWKNDNRNVKDLRDLSEPDQSRMGWFW